MKNVVVSAICGFCVLQAISAATIGEIKARIPQEEVFMNNQISDTKSTIAQSISSKRSTLNARADAIKDEIRSSPPNCHVWLDHIDSIKSGMINFPYQFQRCEESSRLIKLKGDNRMAFLEMNRNADRVGALCIINPSSCQSQIDGLSRSLDLIHNRIVSDIASIRGDSERCVNDRGNSISKSLESAYGSFQKCK